MPIPSPSWWQRSATNGRPQRKRRPALPGLERLESRDVPTVVHLVNSQPDIDACIFGYVYEDGHFLTTSRLCCQVHEAANQREDFSRIASLGLTSR